MSPLPMRRRSDSRAVNYLDPTNLGNLLDDVDLRPAPTSSLTTRTRPTPTGERARPNETRPGEHHPAGQEPETNGSRAASRRTTTWPPTPRPTSPMASSSYRDVRPTIGGRSSARPRLMRDLRTFANIGRRARRRGDQRVRRRSVQGRVQASGSSLTGFDAARFGMGVQYRDRHQGSTGAAGTVEIQRSKANDSMYAEIAAPTGQHAACTRTSSTAHDCPARCTRCGSGTRSRTGTINSHADRMQVLVGADAAHATPVEMTRVTSNGHGDKAGREVHHHHHEGVRTPIPAIMAHNGRPTRARYLVPEGQKNTVFMFKSFEGFKEYETLSGNNIRQSRWTTSNSPARLQADLR